MVVVVTETLSRCCHISSLSASARIFLRSDEPDYGSGGDVAHLDGALGGRDVHGLVVDGRGGCVLVDLDELELREIRIFEILSLLESDASHLLLASAKQHVYELLEQAAFLEGLSFEGGGVLGRHGVRLVLAVGANIIIPSNLMCPHRLVSGRCLALGCACIAKILQHEHAGRSDRSEVSA